MFKVQKILLPLDGSALAECALPYGEALARKSGAQLIVMRAVEVHGVPGADQSKAQIEAIEQAESYVEGLVAGIRSRGVATEAAVPYGDPTSWILEEVSVRHADLVVMATHGRSGFGRWLYGSVAEGVTAGSKVPVLLVRAWEHAPENILGMEKGDQAGLLVPLDGSHLAESALPVAQAFARQFGARLTLVRAVPPVIVPAAVDEFGNGYEYAAEEVARCEAEAQAYLEGVRDRLATVPGATRPPIAVGVGEPSTVIAHAAREHGASLVAMATHGRKGVSRAIFGSVAGRTLLEGSLPLLLIPPAAVTRAPEMVLALQREDEESAKQAVTAHLDLQPIEVALIRAALQSYAQMVSRHEHLHGPLNRLLGHLAAVEEASVPGALGKKESEVARSLTPV